jgi:hypothetical protein
MYAVVVNAIIEPGHQEEALERLRTSVVPTVKQIPGVVGAYWLAPVDGRGLSFALFESEEVARAAAARIPDLPKSEFVSFEKIEVREVVAQV